MVPSRNSTLNPADYQCRQSCSAARKRSAFPEFAVYYAAELRAADQAAKVAELVDALDLGSSGVTRESSSLSFRTRFLWYAISLN